MSIEAIKARVRESLHISRIPKNTKKEFKKLAEEDFEGDYGMCLKWLIDFRKGLLTSPNEQLIAKLQSLKKYDNENRSLEGWSDIILNGQRRLDEKR